MARAQSGNCYWEYNPSIFNTVSRQTFDPAYWQNLSRITGQEQGRGTTWFFEHEGHELVLRHYLRGGFVGKLNRDSYLYTSRDRCRSLHEFSILEQLHKMDLPVPQPAAAQVIRHGLFYQADLIIERIPGAQDLISLLKEPQDTVFYQALGTLVAGFHRKGVYHADLNIKNILIDSQQKLWLIDFDRAQLNVAPGDKQRRSIERLKRSFEKEKIRHGVCFEEADWQVFLESYQKGLRSGD